MTSEHIDEEMREMFEGNFLKAEDLMSSGPITVTISDIVAQNKEKDAKGKLINRPIMSFKGAKKRFIVGKTNLKLIRLDYGGKPSEWIGKTIVLGIRYLREAFGQKNVPCIRVVPKKPIPYSIRVFNGSEESWEGVVDK